jgi:hypothetical protein
MMEKSEVIAGAESIIKAIRRHMPFYAGDFAPARTDQIAELLKRSGCALQVMPFPLAEDGNPIDPAFVMPLLNGINIICIDKNASRTDRQYAIRHELTHVFADEVSDVTYLSDAHYMSSSERIADLVALADLIPGWTINDMRAARSTWRTVRAEIDKGVEWYADGWPCERILDRGGLRLRLFRECGI